MLCWQYKLNVWWVHGLYPQIFHDLGACEHCLAFTLCSLWDCCHLEHLWWGAKCFILFFFILDLPFILATLTSHHRVAVYIKECCFQNLNWCGMDHHVEVHVVLLPGLYIQLRSFDALVTLTLKVSSLWFCLCPSNVIQQRFACVALNLRMVAGDVRVTLFISKETTGTSIVG